MVKAPKNWMVKCEEGCCVKQVWYELSKSCTLNDCLFGKLTDAAQNITRIKRGCSSDAERYMIETYLQAHVCITELTVSSAMVALSLKTVHLQ